MSDQVAARGVITPRTKVTRAASLAFFIGIAATAAALIYTIVQARQLEGAGTVVTDVLSLTFFTSTRAVTEGQSSATLTPGFGVFVLLVLFPAVAALLAWRRTRR
jgi:hypothetical protein